MTSRKLTVLSVLSLLGIVAAGGGIFLCERVERAAEQQARIRLLRERLSGGRQRAASEGSIDLLATATPNEGWRSQTQSPLSVSGTSAIVEEHSQVRGPIAALASIDAAAPPRRSLVKPLPGTFDGPPQAPAPTLESGRTPTSAEPLSLRGAESEAGSTVSDAFLQALASSDESRRSAPGGYVALQTEGMTRGGELGEDMPLQRRESEAQQPSSGGPRPGDLPVPALVPRIILIPDSPAIRAGQTVRVAVHIEGAEDVAAVPFQVQFDGRVLQFERAYQGDYLMRAGEAPLLLAASMEQGDEVAVGLSKLGSGPGNSGGGTLLTLEFRAVGHGITSLRFSREKLLNSRSREVAAEFIPSEVSVM